MSRKPVIAALWLVTLPLLWAGQLLDRTIATVNGHVLLQTEWDDELRYECFMSERALDQVNGEDQKTALNHLIDQELLREQMHSAEFKVVGSEEIDQQMATLKNQPGHAGSPGAWERSLSRYGISEELVREHVELELNQLRLVNARLRPSIQIDSRAVEDYYKQQMLPKLPPGERPLLDRVAPQIRELLVQTKINELLSSWLENLRTQAKIQVLVSEFSSTVAEGQ
jgi:peptidyl-prolyl cis-trans isomerase SurA